MEEASSAPVLGLRAEVSALLSDLGAALVDLVEAPANEDAEASRLHLEAQLHGFWARYYSLRAAHEQSTLSTAVLACCKSGKSTLLNALVGDDLLPVNNVPETARISRITHAPGPTPSLALPAAPARSSSLSSAGSLDLARAASVSSSGGGAPGEPLVLEGAGAIREYLQQLNRDARAREHSKGDEQVLDIHAPLVVLQGLGGGGGGGGAQGAPGGAVKLCLLDTPGPNEAGEEGLKYQVERLLERVDAAIYLLDYTKLKTAEEAQVLGRLRSINPALVSRLCSRLFFAVNKMDQADEGCGLDDDETRAYVAEMVTRQLSCPAFKLHPDQVLLLSARNALLARLVLAGRADAPALARFGRIAFGSFNPRIGSSGSSGRGGRSQGELQAAAQAMLQTSGVPELEARVLAFLFEAAAGVKLVATLDDVGRLLAEVSNVASSCCAALEASASALSSSTAALQGELQTTLQQFDRVLDGTEDLQVEVADELRAHLGALRTRLFQAISDALDAGALAREQQAAADAATAAAVLASDAAEEAARAGQRCGGSQRRRHRAGCGHARRHRHAAAGAAAPGGACAYASASVSSEPAFSEPSEPCDCPEEFDPAPASDWASASAGSSAWQPGAAARPGGAGAGTGAGRGSGGGWWRLRERFLSLFGRSGGAGAVGGSPSKDELSSALMDLSEELMAQIQAEVAEAWHVMEGATNARAARLIASLNRHIEGLAARLEGVVEEGLQVRLEPVSLRMAAPDAVSFHADLSELIDKGIAAHDARHVRSAERTDMVWEARRGACRLSNYYVQVPRRRRVVETFTATSYRLRPEAVAAHFIGVVDEAISATERSLASYVREYVRRQVATARETVQGYGDAYLGSLGAALEAASQGADARQGALAQVSAHCATLEGLRGRLAGLQARAELLVPHNTASGCGLFEQLGEVSDGEEAGPQELQLGLDQPRGEGQGRGEAGEPAAEPGAEADAEAEAQAPVQGEPAGGDAPASEACAAELGPAVCGMAVGPTQAEADAAAVAEAAQADQQGAGAEAVQGAAAARSRSSGSGGLSRVASSAGSSSDQLLSAGEVDEARQAEAAAGGVLLMAALPPAAAAAAAAAAGDGGGQAAAMAAPVLGAGDVAGALLAAADGHAGSAGSAAAAPAVGAEAGGLQLDLIDLASIEGAQPLPEAEAEAAVAAGDAGAAHGAQRGQGAAPAAAGGAGGAGPASPAGSAASGAFSGATAGSTFSRGTQGTQASGLSAAHEALADSVLAGGAAPRPAPAAPGGQAAAPADVAASLGELPPLLSVTDVAGGSAMGPTAAALAREPAGLAALAGLAPPLPALPPAAADSGRSAAMAASQALDTSLYASIIASSEDGGGGSPGAGAYDFRASFSAALSASGLAGVAAPGAPGSEEEGSEWQLVDADEGEGDGEGAAQQAAAARAAGAPASG